MTSERLTLFNKIKMKVRAKANYEGLPQEMKNSFANYAFYRNHLNSTTLELYRLMNGNPECKPDDEFKKEVYAPPGTTAVDQLVRGLNMLKEEAWETELIDRELDFCSHVRELERQFQTNGHNSLRNIRKFLTIDYPKYQYLEMEVVKQSTLAQRGELKDRTNYTQKLADVTRYLAERAASQKVEHLKDIYRFLENYAEHHERMAAEHEKQTHYRPAQFEQPSLKHMKKS